MQNVIVTVNVTGVETVTVVALVTLERATLEDAIVIVDHASGVACGIDHTMVHTIVTCAEDCVYMCYWCMFWESYNTRYRYAERQVIHTPPIQPQMKKEEEEAALQYPVDPTNPNQNQTVGTTSPYYSQYQLTEEQQLNGAKMI
jgi:hypothetical protein